MKEAKENLLENYQFYIRNSNKKKWLQENKKNER